MRLAHVAAGKRGEIKPARGNHFAQVPQRADLGRGESAAAQSLVTRRQDSGWVHLWKCTLQARKDRGCTGRRELLGNNDPNESLKARRPGAQGRRTTDSKHMGDEVAVTFAQPNETGVERRFGDDC